MGISGGQQVGFWQRDIHWHASLWSGTEASWVDLHPTGFEGSCANGISGGQQVGWATLSYAGITHAGLWSGTAASWVDLNPAGATWSQANGVSAGYQVGSADGHASLWNGTAASWVDLEGLLPPDEYCSSSASGIEVSGTDIWIVGTATVPEPSGLLALASGLAGLGGVFFRRRSR